jgi:hypothetical protein
MQPALDGVRLILPTWHRLPPVSSRMKPAFNGASIDPEAATESAVQTKVKQDHGAPLSAFGAAGSADAIWRMTEH